ncbi:MAG: helix-turn-helix transcriptional regulator, partial [Actinomycetota bacterium]|nr:helix-turn-helix transcriptional regulator [Actinomycetota bacterium]
VRDELIAAGGRPRRAALSGVAALTPGERRVAEMAAAGMSNREIAETLYVTMKAVQWHLRHVYRKLGVTDRTEIGACLDEESAPSDA